MHFLSGIGPFWCQRSFSRFPGVTTRNFRSTAGAGPGLRPLLHALCCQNVTSFHYISSWRFSRGHTTKKGFHHQSNHHYGFALVQNLAVGQAAQAIAICKASFTQNAQKSHMSQVTVTVRADAAPKLALKAPRLNLTRVARPSPYIRHDPPARKRALFELQ